MDLLDWFQRAAPNGDELFTAKQERLAVLGTG